jgi:hypothetical protein
VYILEWGKGGHVSAEIILLNTLKNQHQRWINYLFYSVIYDHTANTRNLPQISWEKEWWGEGGATFYSRLLDKYLKTNFKFLVPPTLLVGG